MTRTKFPVGLLIAAAGGVIGQVVCVVTGDYSIAAVFVLATLLTAFAVRSEFAANKSAGRAVSASLAELDGFRARLGDWPDTPEAERVTRAGNTGPNADRPGAAGSTRRPQVQEVP